MRRSHKRGLAGAALLGVLGLAISLVLSAGAAGGPMSAKDAIGWVQNPVKLSESTPPPNYKNIKMVWPTAIPAITKADLAKLRGMKVTVGFAMQTIQIPFMQRVQFGFTTVMKMAGVKVISTDANHDPSKQLTDVTGLINRGARSIVVLPVDDKAAVSINNALSKAKIPAFYLDEFPVKGKFTTILTHDFFGGGKIGGLALCAALGKMNPQPEVAHFRYPYSAYSVDQRIAGYLAGIKTCGLKDVAEMKGITPAEGLRLFSDVLTAHPNVKGGWAYYDGIALGGVQAMQQAGLKGTDAAFASHDLASLQTAEMICKPDSLWKATAASQSTVYGVEAAKLMLNNLLGRAVPHGVLSPVVAVNQKNVAVWYKALSGQAVPASACAAGS